MESYIGEAVDWEHSLAVGEKILPTINILTLYGQMNLVNDSKAKMEADLIDVQASSCLIRALLTAFTARYAWHHSLFAARRLLCSPRTVHCSLPTSHVCHLTCHTHHTQTTIAHHTHLSPPSEQCAPPTT